MSIYFYKVGELNDFFERHELPKITQKEIDTLNCQSNIVLTLRKFPLISSLLRMFIMKDVGFFSYVSSVSI